MANKFPIDSCSEEPPPSRMRAFWEKLPALQLPWMLTSCGGPYTADLSQEVVSTELIRADSLPPSQSTGNLLRRPSEPADQKGANTNGKDRDGGRPDPGMQLNPMISIMRLNLSTSIVHHKCANPQPV